MQIPGSEITEPYVPVNIIEKKNPIFIAIHYE